MRKVQHTASMNRRLSWAGLPCLPSPPGRCGLIRSQTASVISWRRCAAVILPTCHTLTFPAIYHLSVVLTTPPNPSFTQSSRSTTSLSPHNAPEESSKIGIGLIFITHQSLPHHHRRGPRPWDRTVSIRQLPSLRRFPVFRRHPSARCSLTQSLPPDWEPSPHAKRSRILVGDSPAAPGTANRPAATLTILSFIQQHSLVKQQADKPNCS